MDARTARRLRAVMTFDCALETAMDRTDAATERRMALVRATAIESSRCGDGRFLEGEATITPERGMSFMGAMARAAQAARDFEDTLLSVRRVTGD